MARGNRTRGFTLIELLVVVAIIALLISILLPSLSQAREQGKKAVCLSNLKSIATSSHTYATEDPRGVLIGESPAAVRRDITTDLPGDWGWRTALPYAYGGRTPQKPIKIKTAPYTTLMAETDGGTGWWEAHRRPLNKYVYGSIDAADAKKLRMFQCPSDKGYPDSKWTIGSGPDDSNDCPEGSAEIPLYDMLGNSYRINTCGMLDGSVRWFFNTGAEGHPVDAISYPSRVVSYSEPLFYAMSRQGANEDPTLERLTGWHGKVMSDNAAYCDGSATTTKVEKLAVFDDVMLDEMNFSKQWYSYRYGFLRRGKTWQTDCYPSPGAVTRRWTLSGAGGEFEWSNNTGWPFDNFISNKYPR